MIKQLTYKQFDELYSKSIISSRHVDLFLLAEYLESSQMSHPFDMNQWCDRKITDAGYPECGTACCAIGVACELFKDRPERLKIIMTHSGHHVYHPEIILIESGTPDHYKNNKSIGNIYNHLSVLSHFPAICKFFDLTDYQARFLFLADSYPQLVNITPKDVATRIRSLLLYIYRYNFEDFSLISTDLSYLPDIDNSLCDETFPDISAESDISADQ